MLYVANVTPEGELINQKGLGNVELGWHRDLTYQPIPPRGSCLLAHEIPSAGGMTYFSNMYAACNALSDSLRQQGEALQVVHDSSRNSAGRPRTGAIVTDDPTKTPGARHPIVCRHPWTKRKMIFFGRREGSYIPSKPLDESEALLDTYWQHATQPRWAWGHAWQVGDVLLWDNLATMHRRDAFEGTERRVLHRTQLKGRAPLPCLNSTHVLKQMLCDSKKLWVFVGFCGFSGSEKRVAIALLKKRWNAGLRQNDAKQMRLGR